MFAKRFFEISIFISEELNANEKTETLNKLYSNIAPVVSLVDLGSLHTGRSPFICNKLKSKEICAPMSVHVRFKQHHENEREKTE